MSNRLEIIGEGVGDNRDDAREKAKKLRETLKKAFPEDDLRVFYEEGPFSSLCVSFYVMREIPKNKK